MRIGIIAFLHESNTFVTKPTTIESFKHDLYLIGDDIANKLADSHHEVGGFFKGLASSEASVASVPLVAFRATPAGPISADTFEHLIGEIDRSLQNAGSLDGLLVAAHGAAVSENELDADGKLLEMLRVRVGKHVPIIATIDPHANLSRRMVDNADALIAYRTNPHIDQRDRGIEAAKLIVQSVRGEVRLTMAASFLPLVINIDRQCTSDPHLKTIYDFADRQRVDSALLSNSVVLGFPYANVAEMGTSTIAIADGNMALAARASDAVAQAIWDNRSEMEGRLTSVSDAIDQCHRFANDRICLLDMGDNVGGGSAADGTTLLQALLNCSTRSFFVCIFDPDSVHDCVAAGVGTDVPLTIGGKTDEQHGQPVAATARVRSIHDGKFREEQPRHGGIVEFDQGTTAIVTVRSKSSKGTIMLTSRRMVPFSLCQLTSCQLKPDDVEIIVAKGVNAPIAAYEPVRDRFIRVNTIGSTTADLPRLDFSLRRRPMFPF
ncbi:MAG: M81 family metallopeptidase, partial [Planctomycetales bacterium]|nr:M81 family metallopeptidase [Planctomycetales bacterium]